MYRVLTVGRDQDVGSWKRVLWRHCEKGGTFCPEERDAETKRTQTSERRLGRGGRPALVDLNGQNQFECGELTRSDIPFLLRV